MFAGSGPTLLVTLLLRSKLVDEDRLQEPAVVLAIFEQPKDKLCVLPPVLLRNARVYAVLLDRTCLGVNDLKLRVMTVLAGVIHSSITVSSTGGGDGGEGVHDASVGHFVRVAFSAILIEYHM